MPQPFRLAEEAEVRKTTPKAILVDAEGETIWVPKSCVHEDSEVYDDTDDGRGPGALIVAEWWAESEGYA